MKLREYEAKAIFRQQGILVPFGIVVKDVSEAREAVKKIGKSVILKPQTITKGRGKAGLIRFAQTLEEAEAHAEELLKSSFMGESIREVLIEEKIETVREVYVSVAIDRAKGKPVIIISSEGGIEVESIAKDFPNRITSLEVDISSGIREYKVRTEAKKIGFSGRLLAEVTAAVMNLYEIFEKYDAETVEVNPLMVTEEGKVVAVDAVINIDDDSLYRHPEIKALERPVINMLEDRARKMGFSFVELDGDIGVLGNGAGLALATLDMVELYGGRPAYFFDIGGGISSDGMKKALELALQSPRARVVLLNIFAGISRCDEIATGILAVHKEKKIDRPIVIRFSGTNEREGIEILAPLGIPVFTSMDEAVEKIVSLSRM